MYLSPSKVKTYETCKLKFKLQYEDQIKKPQPVSAELTFGNYLHKFIELYGRKPTIEIINQLKEEFDISKDLENALISSIGHTVKFLKQYEKYEKCEAEYKFGITYKGIKLGGKVDRIYTASDDVDVIDFKTGKKFYKGLNDLQLKFYSLMISHERDIEPEHINTIIYFSRPDKSDIKVYTTKDIEYFGGYLIEVADRIRSTRSWAPSKNNLCRFCQYIDDCPIMKKA